MAASSLLIWIVILPFTQPQQWRRQRADHLSRAGKYPELISYLSSYPQSSFPPHWDPPPRNDSRTRAYDLLAARSAFDMLPAEKIAPWVRNAYMTKFADEHMNYYHPLGFMSPKETQHTRDLLQQLGIEHEGKDHQELEARIREYRNRARNPSGI